MKCVICGKDILDQDVFMTIKIDISRLIYNICEEENNFLMPNGPVHSTTKFTLCENCSRGLMKLAPKDIAAALIKIKL